jgi:hypothetical protein
VLKNPAQVELSKVTFEAIALLFKAIFLHYRKGVTTTDNVKLGNALTCALQSGILGFSRRRLGINPENKLLYSKLVGLYCGVSRFFVDPTQPHGLTDALHSHSVVT